MKRRRRSTLNIDIDEGKPFYVSRIEFHGKYDHARQGDPARAAAGRRTDLQQPAVGAVDSAAEPAELLRDVEGGAGLREPPEYGRRNGRPAAEAEGEGQELDRLERRNQRPVGNLHRVELRDQQLPWTGRDAVGAGEHRRSVAHDQLRIYGAVPARQADFGRGAGVCHQVRLQPVEEPVDDRGDRESVGGATVAADELQHSRRPD